MAGEDLGDLDISSDALARVSLPHRDHQVLHSVSFLVFYLI